MHLKKLGFLKTLLTNVSQKKQHLSAEQRVKSTSAWLQGSTPDICAKKEICQKKKLIQKSAKPNKQICDEKKQELLKFNVNVKEKL